MDSICFCNRINRGLIRVHGWIGFCKVRCLTTCTAVFVNGITNRGANRCGAFMTLRPKSSMPPVHTHPCHTRGCLAIPVCCIHDLVPQLEHAADSHTSMSYKRIPFNTRMLQSWPCAPSRACRRLTRINVIREHVLQDPYVCTTPARCSARHPAHCSWDFENRNVDVVFLFRMCPDSEDRVLCARYA